MDDKEKKEEELNQTEITEEQETEDDDDDFFQNLLNGEEDDEEKEVSDNAQLDAEEEQRRKNKDAEEARKRREAEAKAKQEAEAKAKQEEEAKAKQDPDKKEDAEKKQKEIDKLGEQLVEFKRKYPQIDLRALDKDSNFRNFIDGKLLVKKDFIGLYEDYLELHTNVSGKAKEDIIKTYELKKQSSSGTSVSKTTQSEGEIFTEAELEKIVNKIPLMNDKDFAKVSAKFEKSLAYYKNKK